MSRRTLLPFLDYQRIYQVTYSVLEASGIAVTHRACLFFASAGVLILRDHYGLAATLSAGTMALMIDEVKADVVVYGREQDGVFVKDEDAFHAWVECDGWLIDFMAPIMGLALREDGHPREVPRRMMQKPLVDQQPSLAAIQHVGDFFVDHDRVLTESLLDTQAVQFSDLVKVCLAWFRRPPKPLKEMGMGDSHGQTKRLVARAPSIEGVW